MRTLVSTYFDLVRIGCAVLVVLYHVWPIAFPAHPLPWPGHDAVIVFFVLSGYVIAYVADRKERNLRQFALNRLTRLWSVAVPALLLAIFVSSVPGTATVSNVAPSAQSTIGLTFRSVLNLFFVAQCWNLNIWPPLNLPFWSLDYEAWYYAMFGAWTYLGRRHRLWIAILLALFAGPKILLLMPCWILGVWIYRHPIKLSETAAVVLFLTSVVAYLVFFHERVPALIGDRMVLLWPAAFQRLGWSHFFASDWLLAIIVAANFAAIGCLGRSERVLLPLQKLSQWASSYTFSTYLYHMPLVVLLWGGLQLHDWRIWIGLAFGVVCLGSVTEHRRDWLRQRIARFTDFVGLRLAMEVQSGRAEGAHRHAH